MSLAIYRKYRPAVFEDLLGQEIIAKILKEAAKKDKFSHAYLFAGPRGTGKTTTARLIAKTVNCETRASNASFRAKGEPCNECRFCQSIDEGKCLDVIEIDAASNRGIDEIRDLKENIRTAPLSAKYKVFIIDEMHQLTKDAFNALLKSLEEPPPYVVFILATTEFEKVPATIASRTQQFYFKHISVNEISQKIKSISQKEGVKISAEALELIASAGEGSFRDAESLLDQFIAFGDKDITLEDVEKTIGKVGFDKLSQFAEVLLKNDAKGALESLSQIDDAGYNLTQFTKDLIQYLRRTAVLNFNPQMENLFEKELSRNHLQTLMKHAAIFKENHLNLLKSLINAYSQMRYSQFPIIPLEVALIESLKN